MKMVRCDVATVAAPFPQPLRFSEAPMTTNTAVVVHLEEVDGAIGFGYAPTFNFGTESLRSLVAKDFAPSLLHVELETANEAIDAMRRIAAIAGRLTGTARLAMSVLEMALLDIEAQLAGLPLHRFWGQETTTIRAYASGGWRHLNREQLIAFVAEAIDQGFSTVKLQVGLSPEEDAARLRAVRDAVGPQVGLMLDANQQIAPAEIERWIDALAPFDPIWLEEPVAAEDHRLLGSVKGSAPFAIAAGESETEAQLLFELLEELALDVIQPDAYRVGLTAVRDVCGRACRLGVTSAPHMAHEVSAHVLSGQSDEGWLEYFDWFNDWWEEPVIPVGGRVTPPGRPGHGLKLRKGWLDVHLSASLVTVSSSTGDGRVRAAVREAARRLAPRTHERSLSQLLAPDELKHRLPGALVFAPTPFRSETLEVDLPGFRRNLEFLAAGGIQAVAVAGFVGEFSALNATEYESVLQVAREAFGPDRLIVAGVGFGTALATEYAAAAERNGADCVMLLPPYLVEPTADGLVALTRAVADATRLGVMVHSMPGYPFTARLVERMAAIPGVVSYKDELGDVRGFAEIVDHVGDQLVYVNGRAEPVMAYYAAAGATVLATAIGNFDPTLALEAYAAAEAKDFERMHAVLAPRAMPWYRLRERNRGFLISVSKASMNLVGLAGGSVRPPLSDLHADVERELVELLSEIKYLEVAR